MKKLFLIAAIVLLGSCTRGYETNLLLDSKENKTAIFTLKEQAKQITQDMLNKIDPATRGYVRKIATVDVITYDQLFGTRTRNESDSTENGGKHINPALVIVNFEDSTGYGLLVPKFDEDDIYNPEDDEENWTNSLGLLAITDSGAITTEQITSDGSDNNSNPTDGATNPTNVYDETVGDYAIGGNVTPEEWITNLATSYIYNKENNPSFDSMTIYDNLKYNETEAIAKEKVEPMLKTNWWQTAPFNAQVHTYNSAGDRRPLGCTTIAAAQILVYLKNRYPSMYFGVNSSWSQIESEDFTQYGNDYSNLSTTALNTTMILKQMADGIGVQYNYLGSGGTFAFPKDVKNYLESELNYNITKATGGKMYDRLEDIVKSLNKNKPVWMAGLDGLRNGHAWVVDGYKKNDNATKGKHDYFIHCNFGWGGKNNGWYLMDLFNSSSEESLDPGVGERDMNFNWAFRYLFFE